MKRLLMYSQDGMGLGHLRRSRRIANEVLALNPECNILILADSPVTPFFDTLGGVDYVKLPTIVKTGALAWQGGSLSLELRQLLKIRASLILQSYRSFRPDVVLIDHMPVGALGELKPTLSEAASERHSAKFFLGLRDVLDEPEVIRDAWSRLGVYDYLSCYEAILIYGCREIYPVESHYQLTPYAKRLQYCNYVAPRMEVDSLSLLSGKPSVLVMGGGGKDGFQLAKTLLEGMPSILKDIEVEIHILTGPNMSKADRAALAGQTDSYPVQILRSTDDATSLLRRASVVVTMAGYNSLSEILSYQKKALVVPRSGPSREQRIRSGFFSKRQLIRTLGPCDLTPERLAHGLTKLLTEDGVPDLTKIPPLDGAQRAATLLTS